MFPDYGHCWPLREAGSGKYSMDPTDYGLSDDLVSALRRWYDDCERNCPLDGTWPSPEYGRRWGKAGLALSRWLNTEVGPLITVSYEADNLY